MIRITRHGPAFALAILLGALAFSAGAGDLLTLEARRQLDLEHYVVTDRHAGYFDVTARRQWLEHADAPILRRQIDRLAMEVGCRDKLALPIIDHELRMPAFYQNPSAWREAIRPLFAFEDAVSDLAGAYVASGDRYFADCLIDLLHVWAAADALTKFHYTPSERQAWFNIEDLLFAAGLAYAVVRDQIDDRRDDKDTIDAWLARAARIHLSIEGGPSSCCNNHFYRRALYSTIIGILNAEDDLFRAGVAAIHSALHELGARGELPREISRGERAIHYQNYALLYLIPIAELIERQGYAAYAQSVNGRTLHDAVALAMEILEDPAELRDLAAHAQNLRFIGDRQYFAWMEIYLRRFPNARIERWLAERRPVYNRSAGGHVTLFFWEPKPGMAAEQAQLQRTVGTP
ncbi:MAG: alginate lyase family protein [Alphaproteobacteria bacterium]|nr:alginate lyase family protein [Alphaproteobacteria bacterium]